MNLTKITSTYSSYFDDISLKIDHELQAMRLCCMNRSCLQVSEVREDGSSRLQLPSATHRRSRMTIFSRNTFARSTRDSTSKRTDRYYPKGDGCEPASER